MLMINEKQSEREKKKKTNDIVFLYELFTWEPVRNDRTNYQTVHASG